MAQCKRFVCKSCGKAIEAWDDGNPYYVDKRGKKHYAYHPEKERDRCTGNDSAYLCLGCGAEFMNDLEAPVAACPKCGSPKMADCYKLGGKPCPYCKKGKFAVDPDYFAIS